MQDGNCRLTGLYVAVSFVVLLSVISRRSFLSLLPGRGRAHIIRAAGAIIGSIICDPRYGDEVRTETAPTATESPLRQRFCRGPALVPCCLGMAGVSVVNATAAANVVRQLGRQQQRAASGRYQQTEAGREAHRARQRSYRRRRCRPRVTHQASESITKPSIVQISLPLRCSVCGC